MGGCLLLITTIITVKYIYLEYYASIVLTVVIHSLCLKNTVDDHQSAHEGGNMFIHIKNMPVCKYGVQIHLQYYRTIYSVHM